MLPNVKKSCSENTSDTCKISIAGVGAGIWQEVMPFRNATVRFQRTFSGLHLMKGWKLLIPMTTANLSHTEKKISGKKKYTSWFFSLKKKKSYIIDMRFLLRTWKVHDSPQLIMVTKLRIYENHFPCSKEENIVRRER